MAKHRILIVDDQREVRQMLRAGVETLGPDFEVVDVPSGEEAVLEFSWGTFDLVVLDVLLPGISGLELFKKLRTKNPELKLILITGAEDRHIRRQVADAGASAYFLKPIETADFLDAIERALGLVETSATPIPVVESKPSQGVSDRLSSLRQELNAISAFLLDEHGRILVQAGDLPDHIAETNLIPSLMSAFSASAKIAHFLGQNPPEEILYFSGSKYDLFLSHVGQSTALLVVINPITLDDDLSTIIRKVYAGLRDLLHIFKHLGVPLKDEEQPAMEVGELEEEFIEEDETEAPILDAIFKGVDIGTVSKTADEFWETLSQDDTGNEVVSADALTYEQAKKLGLTPEDEE